MPHFYTFILMMKTHGEQRFVRTLGVIQLFHFYLFCIWIRVVGMSSIDLNVGNMPKITLTRSHAIGRDEIRCPCSLCSNNFFLPRSKVETHLFITWIDPKLHGMDNS